LRLGLVLEPHVDITLEASLHAQLTPSGSLVVGVPCVQQVDRGRFVCARTAVPGELRPSEVTSLEATLTQLAAAVQRAGYFGPLGVDAYRYVDGEGRTRWNPCGELNARFTMGFAAGMRAAGVNG
jgi:phosphoribosylaminoimidazole carboxylase (NCAIR synthetase)